MKYQLIVTMLILTFVSAGGLVYSQQSLAQAISSVDLNNDSCIDRDDYNLLMSNIRSGEAYDSFYDLNGDGKVNRADGRTMVALFTHPRGATCPEPLVPVITWKSQVISLTIAPGESLSENISANVSGVHSGLNIDVSPLLQPFITVTPTEIPSSTEDQALMFTITVNIPQESSFETIEGEIALGNELTGQSIPVVLNIWEKISNTIGGYSFNLPPNSELETEQNGGVTFIGFQEDIASNEEYPRIQITIDQNPSLFSVVEFYDGYYGPDFFGQSNYIYEVITVDNIEAYKFVPHVTFAGDVIIVIPWSDRFIVITDHGMSFQANGIFQRVLDTFNLGDLSED
jgi:hypothetical protein